MRFKEHFEIIVQAAATCDSSDLARTVTHAGEIRQALEAAYPDTEIVMAKGARKQCIGFRFELKHEFSDAAALQSFIDHHLNKTKEALEKARDPDQTLHVHVGFSEGLGFRDDYGLNEAHFSRVIG